MSEQPKYSDTILAAIDGSAASKAAAESAIEIARIDGMKISGLYVVDEVLILDRYTNYKAELVVDIEPPNGQIVEAFEEQGARAIEWLEHRCRDAGVPVTTELLFGGVAELIVDKAKRAGMLALGRRGHRHANDSDHLGSMFRHAAHHTTAPLLVGGEAPRTLDHLMLAYDGSEKARRALDWVARLQRESGSKVSVVSVTRDLYAFEAWIEAMRAEIERSSLVDFKFEGREGEPAEEIVAAAEQNQADLIVAGRYQHSEFVDWFTGSTLDRILRETPIAVLAA